MATHHLKLTGIVFLLGIFLLPGLVQGIQLGSVSKFNDLVIPPGGRAEFEILLWTTENESHPVEITIHEIPEDFQTIVFPEEFNLSKNPEGNIELISLPNTENPVKAKKVKIYVDVPRHVEKKIYEFYAKAIAGNRDDDISVLQERTFIFTIDVREQVITAEKNPVDKFLGDIYKGITGFFINNPPGQTGVAIALLIIFILIAWRVYKHE